MAITVKRTTNPWRRCNGCGAEEVALASVTLMPKGGSAYKTRLCERCCVELRGSLADLRRLFDDQTTEGWAYPEPRAPNTKLHYFVGANSLCRRHEQPALLFVTGVIARDDCCRGCYAKALRDNKIV